MAFETTPLLFEPERSFALPLNGIHTLRSDIKFICALIECPINKAKIKYVNFLI
jgi:hypothetical protein